MAQNTPTMLSLVAAAFYVVIAITCILAASKSRDRASWAHLAWIALALLFFALVLMRVLALENVMRAELRGILRGSELYGGRRSMQGIIAGLLAAVCAIGFALFWKFGRQKLKGARNRSCLYAVAAGGAMIGLVGLRLLSWHTTDALLFGPLKLNWVLDLGLASAVGWFALVFIRSSRSKRPRPADR